MHLQDMAPPPDTSYSFPSGALSLEPFLLSLTFLEVSLKLSLGFSLYLSLKLFLKLSFQLFLELTDNAA